MGQRTFKCLETNSIAVRMKQTHKSNYLNPKKKLKILENLEYILYLLVLWSIAYAFLRLLAWILLWLIYGESSDLIPNILSQFVPETSFLGLNKILHSVITSALGPFLFFGILALSTEKLFENKMKKLREEITDYENN